MKTRSPQNNRGFSLIELMVGIAVSLVLIAIASSIFVGGVRSSRVQEEKSKQVETAQLVLDILGRDIRNAGFYPMSNPGKSTDNPILQSTVGYPRSGFPKNIVNLANPAFDNAIFACANAKYDRNTGQCLGSSDNPGSDTLLINSFSDDSFAQTANSYPGVGSGTRMNCLNQSADTQAHNQTASNNTSPIMVTNIYHLGVTQSYQSNLGTVTTRSFGCWPLGPQPAWQPFFLGVEQLRFRFGLIDAASAALQTPRRFYTTTEMNALPLTLINGANMTAWRRVVAIEVCVQTRSLENNARAAPNSAAPKDCDGNTITFNADQPRPIVAVTREVFNLRNAAGVTL
jgi:type IV pilus assembly protein PilW